MCKQPQILGREQWTVPMTLWGSARQDSLEHVCLMHVRIWWVCCYSSQCSQGRRASCYTHTRLPAGCSLEAWDHGKLDLKKSIPKGGDGGKRKQANNNCMHRPQDNLVFQEKPSPSHPSPILKIKTKINHEGKEGKTSPNLMFVLGLLQQLLYLTFICLCGVS